MLTVEDFRSAMLQVELSLGKDVAKIEPSEKFRSFSFGLFNSIKRLIQNKDHLERATTNLKSRIRKTPVEADWRKSLLDTAKNEPFVKPPIKRQEVDFYPPPVEALLLMISAKQHDSSAFKRAQARIGISDEELFSLHEKWKAISPL